MLADVTDGPRATALAEPAAVEPLTRPAQRWAVAATALGLAAFLVFSGLAIARHQAYASGRQDLEIYLQTLWNTAQGRPFATTLLKSNELHLAEHLALALLPLAPLYGLLPDPRLLIVLQQAA